MKGFIIAAAIILVVAIVVIGVVAISHLTTSFKIDHEKTIAKKIENMGFSVIKRLDCDATNIYLVYDTATNAEYIVEFGNGNVSFCPYYDANGNVSTYGGGLTD